VEYDRPSLNIVQFYISQASSKYSLLTILCILHCKTREEEGASGGHSGQHWWGGRWTGPTL